MTDPTITRLYLNPNTKITNPLAFKNMVFGERQMLDINTNTAFLNLYEAYKQLLKQKKETMSWHHGNLVVLQRGFIALWSPLPHENWRSYTRHSDALGDSSFIPAQILDPQRSPASDPGYISFEISPQFRPNLPRAPKALNASAAPFVPRLVLEVDDDKFFRRFEQSQVRYKPRTKSKFVWEQL